VATAVMVGGFLMAKTPVHVVDGYIEAHVAGDVRVEEPPDKIQRVMLCDKKNCASLNSVTEFGYQSWGLSVVPPARNPLRP
jgi:hypothetical protein